MRMGVRAGSLMAIAMASAVPSAGAAAEWREARGRHFIVYSEGSEASVREAATRLEQLDALMRIISGTPKGMDDIANPLTVYVVGDVATIRRLYGRGGTDVAGFYLPRVTGSVAYSPAYTGSDDFQPQLVLFHEYGHHFLLGNYAAPYPAWFSEGYSEFISTTRFDDSTVTFGNPANHRAYTLATSSALTAERLFAGGSRALRGDEEDALYGRGWLLTHLIMFDPERARQFNDYMARVSAGEASADAAKAAFGDMRAFNRQIAAYLSRNRFAGKRLSRDQLKIGPIALRTLRPGEAAMIRLRMRSERGVTRDEAKSLLAQGQKAAAGYPTDPTVQGWLAEMAYDAGEDAAADVAADRALAADPRSIQALLYKARVALRRASAAKSDAGWKEARSWIVRANKVDNNNAAALSLYYASFAMADQQPSKSAVAGLRMASEIVPQDPSLRWLAARQLLKDGDVIAAKAVLRPLAFDPHAGPDNPAAKVLALLDGGMGGPDALGKIEKKDGAKTDD